MLIAALILNFQRGSDSAGAVHEVMQLLRDAFIVELK
jgi:hypothetical protein